MKAMQGTDRPSNRAILVALNAAPGLGRAALCRLALYLYGWRDGVPAGGERALAARLSIPLDSIRAALGCLQAAPSVLAAEERVARATRRWSSKRPLTASVPPLLDRAVVK